MEAIRIRVPEQIIENVGDVLNGPVMGRKRIEKKVMPKTLQNQERAFDKRIVVREVLVVPDKLPLERRKMNGESRQRENGTAHPDALDESAEFVKRGAVSSA